jgi:hypothetical protein
VELDEAALVVPAAVLAAVLVAELVALAVEATVDVVLALPPVPVLAVVACVSTLEQAWMLPTVTVPTRANQAKGIARIDSLLGRNSAPWSLP